MARRTFDDSKDAVVRMLPDVDLGEGEAIELKICSFDGGPPKLQMSRKKDKGGEIYYGKLGRINAEDMKLLAPRLVELAENPELWRS